MDKRYNPSTDPPDISTRDLCRRFQVGKRTIFRWIAEGRLPEPVRLTARTLRWRESDVQAFIERGGSRRKKKGCG